MYGEIICKCGHMPEEHTEEGYCQQCECEIFRLKEQKITILEMVKWEDRRFLNDIEISQCKRCLRWLACNIIVKAQEAKPGQLIAGLLIEGVGREGLIDNPVLRCREFKPLPERKTRGRRKETENLSLWSAFEFESREHYRLRTAK